MSVATCAHGQIGYCLGELSGSALREVRARIRIAWTWAYRETGSEVLADRYASAYSDAWPVEPDLKHSRKSFVELVGDVR